MKYLIALVLLVAAFALLLRFMENHFVFFPTKYPEGYWQPEVFGLEAEDCYFTTADGVRLHGWFVAKEDAIATLLWCHGNAGNITHRLDNLAKLHELPVNVFIFDYRGYGRSDGEPSEQGVYLDARAAYDFLVENRGIAPETIVLFGRSLGGAVAVDLAVERRCAGLILESTFTSARDMARAAFGPLPVHWIMKTDFNCVAKIRRYRGPLLMLHGTADRTVPLRLGGRLYQAANPPKEFYEIPGADHNDTYLVGGKAYFEKLRAFVEEVR